MIFHWSINSFESEEMVNLVENARVSLFDGKVSMSFGIKNIPRD